MANPNPSPETRFKPGESGNPSGRSTEEQKAWSEAAAISAQLKLKALSCLQEKIDAGEIDPLEVIEANTLKLFKDSEDRAHGTPKATTEMSGPDGGAIPVTAVEYTVFDPKNVDKA